MTTENQNNDAEDKISGDVPDGDAPAQQLGPDSYVAPSPILQVRDVLSKRFPNKTISVSETGWYHGGGIARYTEYVISVQPGFDGYENQNFSGNSLHECLNKLNIAAYK